MGHHEAIFRQGKHVRQNTHYLYRSVYLSYLAGPAVVSAHGHDHGHSHEGNDENPAFKYSRAANIDEDEIMEEDIVELPPQRGPPPKVKCMVHFKAPPLWISSTQILVCVKLP